MNSFKQKVSELRKNTPRHIQWLLLGAAFVVVLILLTILLGGKDDNNQEIAQMNTAPAELKIEPEMINWADVIVGEKKEQKIIINATAPVIVKEVAQVKDKQNDDVNRFVSTRSTCEGQKIDTAVACNITVSYTPSTPMQTTQARIIVKWHRAEDAEDMTMTDDIVLTLGADAPVIEEKPIAKPEPVPEPEPEVEEEITEEEIVEEEEPETIQEEIVREIETIAPPVVTPSKTETKKEIVIPDGCSDFAFPAYNNSGRQIGWVKPSGGAYYYHSFDDKNCTDPSGTYNPDNGIITDDSGKKIGTDADHIGYATIASGILPELSNTPAVKPVYRARQKETGSTSGGMGRTTGEQGQSIVKPAKEPDVDYDGTGEGSVISSKQQDRQFILRQFKPIPATIVSDIRADPQTLANNKLPVRATVDRNVYSDNGRNVIIPTGTLLLGYVDGELPGPYTSIGRMDIKWYQFVLPNGVEFNFKANNVPFSGDAQGRSGIPGYGSTDYLEQFFMPMLTAIVPAAVNLIAPISDKFVNQIDLDNNTVVQSGTVRSSELAKNEIVTAWNQVAQKLMVDMMDNTVPPFTIAAGTRITVYSPVDLIASCGKKGDGKICSLGYGSENRLDNWSHSTTMAEDSSWVGQVRSFAVNEYCTSDGKVNPECKDSRKCGGYDYATLLFYCQSSQYKAINIARQEQVFNNQMDETNTNSISSIKSQGEKAYNEQVLGLTYNEETGAIENPFNKPAPAVEEMAAAETLLCLDGTAPDANGCCTGEIYTDMGEQGFNCCPETGGDCFPPML